MPVPSTSVVPVQLGDAQSVEATSIATAETLTATIGLPAAALGTPSGDPTSGSPAEVGTAALASLPIDWQSLLPGWSVSFEGFNESLLGATAWAERHITIYVRPEQSVDQVRHVLAHELGHALDITHLDDSARSAWSTHRGFDHDSAYWPETSDNDYATPAGDLAETVAAWVNGADHWAGTRAIPTDADIEVLAGLFAQGL